MVVLYSVTRPKAAVPDIKNIKLIVIMILCLTFTFFLTFVPYI